MGLISDIAGVGLQAVGSIVGAVQGKKAYKAMTDSINQQRQKNEDWYNRSYNESATERADAQQLLTYTEQSIMNRNKQAAGAAAVGGATEESIASSKAAGTQALADAVSQINASAANRKDAIQQQYMAQDNAFANQLQQAEAQKAANIAAATKGVTDAAGNIVSSGIFGKK